MIYVKTNELYHHGIKGQKWGQRNGPPYPLNAGAHSAAEKRANPTFGNSDTAMGGIRKPSLSSTVDTKYTIESNIKALSSTGFAVKKQSSTIEEDCEKVNPKYMLSVIGGTSLYTMNCTNCVCTYALRRMGLDVTATSNGFGHTLDEIDDCFKGCVSDKKNNKSLKFKPKEDTAETVKSKVSEAAKSLCGDKPGVGFLTIKGSHWGHVFSWEKLRNGNVVFVDSQSNHVNDRLTDKYFKQVAKGSRVVPEISVYRLDNCTVDSSIKDMSMNRKRRD